ncbi:FliG C-terminal domain-containing protein [Chelativorans sp. AA-79]|uniref:FliG C-terminal domain-containing protein n=1 Tax=Chelativorans sp. AA-79 TaxID=3028735 RepID=UPI0023F9F891|nr:FliG C-terminal domain-containing protein [Chelativorans sp. AA-79]WEX08297.1 FliG C-terminal domain-containing protein [Chelativorans sp. AA-79]
MTASVKLTQAEKAAAILVAMGKPSAGRLLKFFKQDELKALIEAARRLRTIPQAELEKVVQEFEREFSEGAGLLDSADSMNNLLTESLSPEEMNALMGGGEARPAAMQEVWARLERIAPHRLAEILAPEHAQTVAVVLANLAPQAASRVILELDRGQRGEVLRRMASMGQLSAEARTVIERRIAEILRAEAGGKDVSAGHARVARLLNELDKTEADEVIRDLEAVGTSDVDAIRARLFSFEEIVDLSQKARVALLDGLATDVVTLALRDAPGPVVEAVLSALGARSRRMIEAELAAPADGATPEAIAAARRRIAATAVQLAQQGSIDLPSAQKAAA